MAVLLAAAVSVSARPKTEPAPLRGAPGAVKPGGPAASSGSPGVSTRSISEALQPQRQELIFVRKTDRGPIVQISSSRLFDRKTLPSKDAPLILQEAVKWIQKQPAAKSLHLGASVSVEAYTDSRGAKALNRLISEKQAKWVSEYLSQKLPRLRFSFAGFGEENPLASNATPEGQEANRRIEILLTGATQPAAAQVPPPVDTRRPPLP